MLIATKNEKEMLKSILLQFLDAQLYYSKYVPSVVEMKTCNGNSGIFFWSFENIKKHQIKPFPFHKSRF